MDLLTPGASSLLNFRVSKSVFPWRRDEVMLPTEHQVLRTDAAGMPLEWIGLEQAVRLYYTEQVAYACGSLLYRVRGGINARTGLRSRVEVNSIIATFGTRQSRFNHYIPPLNNTTLFRRDAHLCLYCGQHFYERDLSRDHVTPISQNGADTWNNVVTACKRCNNHKAGHTPEQAGMQLLAIPFTPTHAEYIYLKGKRVLADQMEFLLAHFPRTSPLRGRLG